MSWVVFGAYLVFGCHPSASQKNLAHVDEHVSSFESLPSEACGDLLAEHHGIKVYRNYGKGLHSCGSYHRSQDGYDYGPEWQCVEFVRRYYKDHLHHRFPMKGNAKDYFDAKVPHGAISPSRGLIQYRNGRAEKPKEHDLLVCPNMASGYGHVAIVIRVESDRMAILQQNKLPAEEWISLEKQAGNWIIGWDCAGFLRKP